MLEVFVLIGWIDGHNAGGAVAQEFFSLQTCEAAKTMYEKMHGIGEFRRGKDDSWVECVKK